MANPRKVQADIDKLMKKVKEGMDIYDSVFEKVQGAPDKLQKEKFEAELKKEIKKLQRLREQIKGLIANPEVKDKKALEVTRRDIEIKMEAFKVCERETKTKAFSKEGLLAAKNDPVLRAKLKTLQWVNTAIDTLQDQIEQLEYDIENGEAAPAPKKGKKDEGDPRETRITRNNHHILKLEAILRVLEIGDIEPDDVDAIESEVMAYVDGHGDPNFEEDEGVDLYEMFDLPEGMVQNIGGRGSDSESDEEVTSPKKPAAAAPVPVEKTPPQKTVPKQPAAATTPTPAVAAAVPAPASAAKKPEASPAAAVVAGKAIATPVAGAAGKAVPAPIAAAPAAHLATKSAAASPLVAGTQKTPLSATTAQKAPIAAAGPAAAGKSMAAIVAGHRANDEAAKAAALSGTKDQQVPPPNKDLGRVPPSAAAAPQPAPPAAPADEAPIDDEMDENNDDTFGDDAMDGITPGSGSLADMATMTGAKMLMSGGVGDWAKPLPATVSGTQPAHSGNAPRQQSAALGAASAAPTATPAAPTVNKPGAAAPQAPIASQQIKQMQQAQGQPSPSTQPPPPSFVTAAAVTTQPSSAPQQHVAPAPSAPVPHQQQVPVAAAAASSAPLPEVIQRMLNTSLRNLPHTSDCERPKAYAPPNPFATPDYYPQSVHPALSSPDTFTKFDADTLFFIFYYQQTTFQQYLAAKELKRNSWRFHKKFFTWFQRHDRPKTTTDEYEQGTYIYFDYENGWCQRIKSDFVFKYSHLEDQLQ